MNLLPWNFARIIISTALDFETGFSHSYLCQLVGLEGRLDFPEPPCSYPKKLTGMHLLPLRLQACWTSIDFDFLLESAAWVVVAKRLPHRRWHYYYPACFASTDHYSNSNYSTYFVAIIGMPSTSAGIVAGTAFARGLGCSHWDCSSRYLLGQIAAVCLVAVMSFITFAVGFSYSFGA